MSLSDPITFSRFANATATHGTTTTLSALLDAIRAGTWAQQVARVREAYQTGGKAAAKEPKKALMGVTFSGTFSRTGNANLIAHSGLICADLDTLGDRLAPVRAALVGDPRTVALFTSPSGDGLKVVFRCDPARPHLQAFHAAAAHVHALTGETIDGACKNVARLCFVSHDAEAYLAPDVSAIPPLEYPPAVVLADAPSAGGVGQMEGFDEEPVPPEVVARARAHLAGMPAAIAGEHGHDTTFLAALALAWGFGLDDADALPLFVEYNARCVPPWSEDELRHKLDGAREPSPEKPPFKYLLPPPVIPGEPIEAAGFATDLDASARFAKAHADRLRYVPGIGWIFWDGARWAEDAVGRAMELAKGAAREWTQQAASGPDSEARGKMVKSALGLESVGHVKAAVELAKSDPRMVLSADRLDAGPYLLNLRNGTLDLRTGVLRPHRREDLLTKLAPVEYVPGATHPTLARYLAHVEGQTPGMTPFLARCFGAALTGDASPESLFLLQGDGGSGKTTLTEAFAYLLGNYAVKLPFESFVMSRRGASPGGARSDLMRLRGSRLAYASEGDKCERLDAGMVKALTGNEDITAREIFAKQITFAQTWKLWLVSNFEPRADADDTGIWRRMLKIRFAVIPPGQRDPAVKRVLAQDPLARSALLSWALAGCLDWQARGGGRIGLAPPASVEAETAEYQKKQDVLGQWWEDLLASEATLKPAARTSATSLRRNYDEWAKDNGERPVTSRRFADHLRTKGLTEARGHGGVRYWQGVELDAESFFTRTPPIGAGGGH